jgi:hypothetical protein
LSLVALLPRSTSIVVRFDGQGTQHVNYLGADGHVHELWWDTNGWHAADLTAATGAPAAAGRPAGYVFDNQGTQHVNYRGTDGHVHELWWDASGWHAADLTAATGARLPPPQRRQVRGIRCLRARVCRPPRRHGHIRGCRCGLSGARGRPDGGHQGTCH